VQETEISMQWIPFVGCACGVARPSDQWGARSQASFVAGEVTTDADVRKAMAALVHRADAIRRDELHRCRVLRGDAHAIAAAEEVASCVVDALLLPIMIYLESSEDRAGSVLYVRQAFELDGDLATDGPGDGTAQEGPRRGPAPRARRERALR
jgi:hypothetical protein